LPLGTFKKVGGAPYIFRTDATSNGLKSFGENSKAKAAGRNSEVFDELGRPAVGERKRLERERGQGFFDKGVNVKISPMEVGWNKEERCRG